MAVAPLVAQQPTMAMMSPSNGGEVDLATAEEAVARHFRQHLMTLYQLQLEKGMDAVRARIETGKFLEDLLKEWPAADAVRPALPVKASLERAIQLCKQLGPQGDSILRILTDIKLATGG